MKNKLLCVLGGGLILTLFAMPFAGVGLALWTGNNAWLWLCLPIILFLS